MKLFKILFVLVALTFALPFFLHVANGKPKGQALAQPLLSYTPEPHVPVLMYALSPFGTQREDNKGDYILCDRLGDTYQDYGCTAFCDNQIDGQSDPIYNDVCGKPPRNPIYSDPYEENPVKIPVQTYYLLDVLTAEMSPGVVMESQALRAQAIASRSFAWNLFENRKDHIIRNSNFDQVYMPYKFDSLNPSVHPLEPGALDPCAFYITRNESQRRACTAVAAKHYISWWENDAPAQANFQADSFGFTLTGEKAHLKGVSDPISTACDTPQGALVVGLSTSGAMRWARGNQCALERNGNEPWSVTWTRPEQILFHYFTGVHLRDANNNKQIISPDWRWNPLMFQWKAAEQNNQPPVLRPGGSYPVVIQIQNTGLYAWRCLGLNESPIPGSRYYLRYYWSLAGSAEDRWQLGTGKVSVCGTQPGDPSPEKTITIDDVPTVAGNYVLHFDINDSATNSWFRLGGWPTYDVPVQVVSPVTPTPTPTRTRTPTPTPTPTPYILRP